MNYKTKSFLLTCSFVCIYSIAAIVLSKLLNSPVDSIAAWMAIGICSKISADNILDD